MKRLALLLTFSIFCLSCIAQRIVLSKSATIDPPKKMVKARKDEISSLATQRFSSTKYMAKIIQTIPQNVYLVDDMVVFVNSGSITKMKDFLKISKMASDDIGMQIKGYSSKIENIGGKDVFVIDELSEGLKVYRFTTANSAEDFVVTGFVQYKPGEETKARKVLEDIITGLKFN